MIEKRNLPLFQEEDEGYSEICDPNFDNNVPCVCIFYYNLYTTSSECLAYLTCMVIFFIASRKKNKKIDQRTIILLALNVLAFSLHMSYVIYAYTGESNCRKIESWTSYYAFMPPFIFFLIFIWIIFKALVVWRVMES